MTDLSILSRLEPAVLTQLSDAFKLLPDIAVVEAASDRVEARCVGCTFCDDTLPQTD